MNFTSFPSTIGLTSVRFRDTILTMNSKENPTFISKLPKIGMRIIGVEAFQKETKATKKVAEMALQILAPFSKEFWQGYKGKIPPRSEESTAVWAGLLDAGSDVAP